jgi:hypothetical protein
MVVVLSSHAVSTGLKYRRIMTGSVILSSIAKELEFKKIQSHIASSEHTHLRRCEQLLKHKFPQCAPANLETNCLFEIDVSLGNCGCVTVATFLGVPSPLLRQVLLKN